MLSKRLISFVILGALSGLTTACWDSNTTNSGGGDVGSLTISGSVTIPTPPSAGALIISSSPLTKYTETATDGTCQLLNAAFEVLDEVTVVDGTYSFTSIDPQDLVDTVNSTSNTRATFYVRCLDSHGILQMAMTETALSSLESASSDVSALGMGSLSGGVFDLPVSFRSTAMSLLVFEDVIGSGDNPLILSEPPPAITGFSGRVATMGSLMDMVEESETTPLDTTLDSRFSLFTEGVRALEESGVSSEGVLSGGTSVPRAMEILLTGDAEIGPEPMVVEIGPEPMVVEIGPEPMIEMLSSLSEDTTFEEACSLISVSALTLKNTTPSCEESDISELASEVADLSDAIGVLSEDSSFTDYLDDTDFMSLLVRGLFEERSSTTVDLLLSTDGSREIIFESVDRTLTADLEEAVAQDILKEIIKPETILTAGEAEDDSNIENTYFDFLDQAFSNPDYVELYAGILKDNLEDAAFYDLPSTAFEDLFEVIDDGSANFFTDDNTDFNYSEFIDYCLENDLGDESFDASSFANLFEAEKETFHVALDADSCGTGSAAVNHCGLTSSNWGGNCSCDDGCSDRGDCCDNKVTLCGENYFINYLSDKEIPVDGDTANQLGNTASDVDSDSDGVADADDNCPTLANDDQADICSSSAANSGDSSGANSGANGSVNTM